MSADDDPTLLERAAGARPPTDDTETDTLADRPGITARSTSIGGEEVDLADPMTRPTFGDVGSFRSGEYGRPRPREFWTAKQLGQTPPMQLIKITVAQQLMGGQPVVVNPDGEIRGAGADLADLIVDIYRGPHFQELSFDNLLTATVSDLMDLGWAYWEMLPSEGGAFPVAGFKPLPPLQIQHTVDDDGGDLGRDPAFYQVPYKRMGGSISTEGTAVGLERDRVVVMRDPQSSRSDSLYGESVATKVREWLELIVDVDVHQKRHYDDSQLPAGFLHFTGNLSSDDLKAVENDIVEASGDPHDLVTTSTEGDASWIPVGESVVDLDAIKEQQWYFKLVLAAAGLNSNELGIVEGAGFAKETPALQRAIYKKVTKPMLGAIIDPQNAQVLPRIRRGFEASIDQRLRLDLERFDPVQEQIERQETLDEWRERTVSLNEVRGGIGRDAVEVLVDVPELGGEVNIADLPRRVVDLLDPNLDTGEGSEDEGSVETESKTGPPDFESDPVLGEAGAAAELGQTLSERVLKQLEEGVQVQSSFIEEIAYADPTSFLQIEFEREGKTNAVYWYGSVEKFRFFNMIRATSKGKYFNRYIRGEYTYARVQ